MIAVSNSLKSHKIYNSKIHPTDNIIYLLGVYNFCLLDTEHLVRLIACMTFLMQTTYNKVGFRPAVISFSFYIIINFLTS